MTERQSYELQLTINESGVSSNLQALNEALTRDYGKYASLVMPNGISKDEYQEFKDKRAECNRLYKAFDDQRKHVVERYTALTKEAKRLVDTNIKVLADASSNLDKYIKEYETKEQEVKALMIEQCFHEVKQTIEYADIPVKFEQLYSDELLKKTYTEKKVKEYFNDKLSSISNDLKAIDHLDNSYNKQEVRVLYFKSLNLNQALNQYVEDENLRRIINSTVGTEKPSESQKNGEKSDDMDWLTGPMEETVLERTFTVYGTLQQIKGLGDYMNRNHIKFKKVMKGE